MHLRMLCASIHVLRHVSAGVVLQVVLTFSMQGVGNFTNTAVLCVLLVIYNQTQPTKTLPHHYTGWR